MTVVQYDEAAENRHSTSRQTALRTRPRRTLKNDDIFAVRQLAIGAQRADRTESISTTRAFSRGLRNVASRHATNTLPMLIRLKHREDNTMLSSI